MSETDGSGLGLPQVAACLLVGWFVFRWFFKSTDPSSAAARRPPAIDLRRLQQQTEIVRGMFPQFSVAAVQAELLRNGGSVESTAERIISTGFLPEPPAPPVPVTPPTPAPASRPAVPASRRQAASSSSQYPDLITRYNLHSRLHESVDGDSSAPSGSGKGKAPQTKTDRQQAHQQKRDEMILAARRRMEEMDGKQAQGTS